MESTENISLIGWKIWYRNESQFEFINISQNEPLLSIFMESWEETEIIWNCFSDGIIFCKSLIFHYLVDNFVKHTVYLL